MPQQREKNTHKNKKALNFPCFKSRKQLLISLARYLNCQICLQILFSHFIKMKRYQSQYETCIMLERMGEKISFYIYFYEYNHSRYNIFVRARKTFSVYNNKSKDWTIICVFFIIIWDINRCVS
jgi:hypothetical protein